VLACDVRQEELSDEKITLKKPQQITRTILVMHRKKTENTVYSIKGNLEKSG